MNERMERIDFSYSPRHTTCRHVISVVVISIIILFVSYTFSSFVRYLNHLLPFLGDTFRESVAVRHVPFVHSRIEYDRGTTRKLPFYPTATVNALRKFATPIGHWLTLVKRVGYEYCDL